LILVLKRDDAPTKRHAITFYPAIMNKLQRIFRNHQIDLVYSNKGKLKASLGNPKDKTKILQNSGIYQVKCEGCNFVYIGHTKHSLKTLFDEYHHKSNIARHILSQINHNQGHSISLDNLKLVKEVRKQNELDAYESYYISRRKKEGASLMNVAAEKSPHDFSI
jgi:hypothetical protein